MHRLLGAHVLLGRLADDPALTRRARIAIADGKNIVFVSAAVVWEIRIKEAVGKLVLPPDFRNIPDRQAFHSLPVTAEHAHTLEELSFHRRDSFDRILITQARIEGFTIISHDPVFSKHKTPLITV